MKAAAPRVLVIRRRYLGDIVLLGSLFRNLRLHWPKARLAALIEPAYAGVLALNPDVDDVLPFPQTAGDWPRLIVRLRGAGFTHVLDLDNREKTAALTSLTGAPERATIRYAERLILPGLYTSTEIVPREFLDQHHITELNLRILQQIGVPVATRDCRLTPRLEDLAYVRERVSGTEPRTSPVNVLVHPGSRSVWRLWPARDFAAIIDRLHERHGAFVAVIAGPGEQATVNEIFLHLRHPAQRLDQTLTIPQLAALFTLFDVLLCHDSGPMHLAAAVGTRVVALYGSQPVNAWRPLGEGHITLQAPLPCVNCVSPERCKPEDSYHNYCVRNITPERVQTAMCDALEWLKPGQSAAL